MTKEQKRLEYLRNELRAERISYDELHELQALAPFIHESDIELLEAAGVPESTHNAAIEQTELALWAEQPEAFTAYYSLVSDSLNGKPYRVAFRTHGVVQTWLGTQIGIVTSARVYAHNFGARMVSVKVRGDNGADYYGRASYDNGNCITLRRSKS